MKKYDLYRLKGHSSLEKIRVTLYHPRHRGGVDTDERLNMIEGIIMTEAKTSENDDREVNEATSELADSTIESPSTMDKLD